MTDASRLCGSCRYWSEMMAQAIGPGPVQAMCLADDAPYRLRYTSARQGCLKWQHNHHGAVDCPPDDGATARALYAKEEVNSDDT